MLSKRMTRWVVIVVTVIWAVNILAGILSTTYSADQAVNGIFMAIVGGILAVGRRKDDHHDGGDA